MLDYYYYYLSQSCFEKMLTPNSIIVKNNLRLHVSSTGNAGSILNRSLDEDSAGTFNFNLNLAEWLTFLVTLKN